jgi:hypothetical protein
MQKKPGNVELRAMGRTALELIVFSQKVALKSKPKPTLPGILKRRQSSLQFLRIFFLLPEL